MKKDFPYYWMCMACAKEMGGIFPEGHICTVILEICPYCKGKNQSPGEAIIPWVDFNWPDDDQVDIKAKINRD